MAVRRQVFQQQCPLHRERFGHQGYRYGECQLLRASPEPSRLLALAARPDSSDLVDVPVHEGFRLFSFALFDQVDEFQMLGR